MAPTAGEGRLSDAPPPPTGAPQAGPAPRGLWSDAWRDLRANPVFVVAAAVMALFALMALWPGLFTSFYPGNADPHDCVLADSLARPSRTHWFGHDLQGCDYYTRTVHGARVSISIGVLVTGGAVVIAVTLGSVAGYAGGIVDTLITRVTDVWFAIPVILGGIVALTVLRDVDLPLIGAGRGVGQVSLVLIVLAWPTMLRLMRSQVLAVKEEDYVEAARALGAGGGRIVVRHILPNAITPVIVYATITTGVVITAEAALSFLGVGLQRPAISWGLMISVAQDRIVRAPHLLLFPGLFLSLTVFSFVLMGDALRDALDPKLR